MLKLISAGLPMDNLYDSGSVAVHVTPIVSACRCDQMIALVRAAVQ